MTQHPLPHLTHAVTNQAPPREGLDEYADFPVLRDGVRTFGGAWGDAALHDVGRLVGSAAFQADAERANRCTPALRAFDRWGGRVDEVDYDPSYHRVLGAAVEHGAHTAAWAEPRVGANVVRAATFSLFAQVEPGHACPVSMSHAAVPSLAHAPALAEVWVPRLLGRAYDPRLVPFGDGPDRKRGALFGMAMTEKQGGSDVRAGTTLARPAAGDGDGTAGHPGAPHLLTGHKWFCSAPMSDAFLVLARAARRTPSGDERPDDDVSCFLVPRVLDDGARNVFRIQRLKDKLGNRSNASGEIELDGTVGYLVGEPGRGVRAIIEMVARTREDCVHGSAAGMRQAVAEALWHARHRSAFGARLVDQPAMTAVLADLALESEAATLTSLRLAAAVDAGADAVGAAGDTDPGGARAFSRLATAVAKYWVCKRGPAHAYEAMECLGGNGYTEAFPLARRYREQPVMAIWEGSGNVIALDVLRALARDPESFEAFDAEVSVAAGASVVLDRHLARTRRLVQEVRRDPDAAPGQARRLVEALALGLQGSLMVRFARGASGDAFVDARLGDDRGHGFGVLPSGTDLRGILARYTG